MLENDRDEINYHKFLKSVRKMQGVSLEKTAFGVCTKSGMSRIEAGNRLPSKLVRDRLTARLGISGEEYEEYLLPNEFEQWELRMEIIRCINKNKLTDAEKNIKTYESRYIVNEVEEQFVETMKYILYEKRGFSKECLCTQIFHAMVCTVPDMDAAFDGIQLLADQELNLIMEYVSLCTPNVSNQNPAKWKLEKYHQVVEYVKSSSLDKIAQAKIYARLGCLVAKLVLKEYETEESLRYALKLCNDGVEVLRDTVRLYYFVELNEYRIKLIERLLPYLENETEKAELIQLSNTSREWAELFHELYEENDLPVYMQNFTYLYTETECNNVRDVICTRRKMMKLSRRKLCYNICDERTLIRLELAQANPSMVIVRDLFDRLGLCAEYKRARIITSRAEGLHKYSKLLMEANKGNYETALKIHTELCQELDMDVIFNEQEMKRGEAFILRGLGKLSKEEHYEVLVDVLECTLGIDNLLQAENKYLSANELLCVHNFIAYTDGEISKKLKVYCEEICSNILKLEELELSGVTRYEMFMYEYAHYIGEKKEYMKSKVVSKKLLKESLRNKRLLYVVNCEYNDLWVYQKIMESNNETVDKKYVYKSLHRCLLLGIISNKDDWRNFFQQKIRDFMNDD